jgi:hypothetical protein
MNKYAQSYLEGMSKTSGIGSSLLKAVEHPAGQAAAIIGGGAGLGALSDTFFGKEYEDRPFLRSMSTGVNALSGAGAAAALVNPALRAAMLKTTGGWAGVPGAALSGAGVLLAKELGVQGMGMMPEVQKAVEKYNDKSDSSSMSPVAKVLAGLGGAAALGGLGYMATRGGDRLESPGLLRVVLPTKDPNDPETSVEMPLNAANLPPILRDKLMRDTRRRLRQESAERTWHRNPKTNKPLTQPEPGDGGVMAKLKNMVF